MTERNDIFDKAVDTIGSQLVSTQQLADILALDKTTITKWAREKKLSDGCVLELGSCRRFRLKKVLDELNENYAKRRAR